MDHPDSGAPALYVPEADVARRLSQLLEHVRHGGRVVIMRDGEDVAQLLRIEGKPRPQKKSLHGMFKGQIWMADDFDELGPEWDEYVK